MVQVSCGKNRKSAEVTKAYVAYGRLLELLDAIRRVGVFH